MLGSNGVEKIIDLQLTPKEKEMFHRSVESVRELIDTLKNNNYFEDKR